MARATKETIQITDHSSASQIVQIRIESTSPLLMSRFSEESHQKAVAQTLGIPFLNGQKKATPEQQGALSAYYYSFDPLEFGFPAEAFKRCIEAAARRLKNKKLPSTLVRTAVFLTGEKSTDQGDLLKVECGSSRVRYDAVVNQSSGRIVAPRMELSDWSMTVPFEYNSTLISPDQVANLLGFAGSGIGIGAWRPDCGGKFGRFRIVGVQ